MRYVNRQVVDTLKDYAEAPAMGDSWALSWLAFRPS